MSDAYIYIYICIYICIYVYIYREREDMDLQTAMGHLGVFGLDVLRGGLRERRLKREVDLGGQLVAEGGHCVTDLKRKHVLDGDEK